MEAEAGRSGNRRIRRQRSYCRWMMFFVGILLSAGAVGLEIGQLDVCFDEQFGHVDFDIPTEYFKWVEHQEYSTAFTKNIVIAALAFGLAVEVLSGIVLSRVYRSPLDIKSVHKIPPGDLRSMLGNTFLFFLAPFSWAIIYILGGVASIFFAGSPPCNGHEEWVLEQYLNISGVAMVAIGILFFVISVLIIPFSCGSPARCTDGCCAMVRRWIHQYILPLGLLFEIIWQVQGVVWSYRTGVFGFQLAIVVGAGSVLGELLAFWFSFPPDILPLVVGSV